jgi:hypothetical protein
LRIIIIGLLTTVYSCCPFIKEENLGNNVYLSEYDNVDIRILYSKESCSGSGLEIVPMTVLEFNYDSNWIIAKSGSKKREAKTQYWIIKNDFDNESTSGVIKSKTIGPLDEKQFFNELIKRRINLELKKIE